jgi:hypothetical protein
VEGMPCPGENEVSGGAACRFKERGDNCEKRVENSPFCRPDFVDKTLFSQK